MILVTGGSGYVGSHLVTALRAAGEDVKLLRHGTSFSEVQDGWCLDLAAPEQLAALPPMRAQALIHLAGLIDIRLRPNPADASYPPVAGDAPMAPLYRANVLSTAVLADYCVTNRIPIIFASSQTVYGLPETTFVDESTPLRPLEPYASSKIAAESQLRAKADDGLNATVLRFPGVYGGNRRSGAVCSMARAALRHGRIRVVAEFPLPFDVLHVDDVVCGVIAALDRPESGWRCFNLGSGEPCSLTLLAEAIAALVPGCTVERPQIAQPILLMAADAARARLGWAAQSRTERLKHVLSELRAEIVDAA